MSEKLKSVRNMTSDILENKILQVLLVFIFCLPMVSTIGQYISSGFIMQNSKVLILYWPGVKNEFAVSMPVWFSYGLMAISYVVGIAYMFRKGSLGKVVVLGFGGFYLAQFLGDTVNSIVGIHELQQVDSTLLNGVVNRAIFSLWHNPAWEEVVFRGLPFLILLKLKNRFSEIGLKIAVAVYFVIPSVAMVFYHIPNHGVSRIIDTFVFSVISAWLTMRYSFFAPLVLHYIFDTMMIINFGAIKGIDKAEVQWLVNNGNILNTSFAWLTLALLLSIPVLFLWNFKKKDIFKKNKIKSVVFTAMIFVVFVFTLFQFVD
jgi:hypothetical protein